MQGFTCPTTVLGKRPWKDSPPTEESIHWRTCPHLLSKSPIVSEKRILLLGEWSFTSRVLHERFCGARLMAVLQRVAIFKEFLKCHCCHGQSYTVVGGRERVSQDTQENISWCGDNRTVSHQAAIPFRGKLRDLSLELPVVHRFFLRIGQFWNVLPLILACGPGKVPLRFHPHFPY